MSNVAQSLPSELQQIGDVLRALQSPETSVIQEGERKLELAWKQAPNDLVRQLLATLAALSLSGPELRQQAAVLLRQCVTGLSEGSKRQAIWADLDDATKRQLMNQLLESLLTDPIAPVRRNVGSAIASVAESMAEDFDDLQLNWPELLPALSRCVGTGSSSDLRVAALGVMKEMAELIGDGLVSQGPAALAMLQACLGDSVPEVRAAAAQFVFQLIAEIDMKRASALASVMPAILTTMQSLTASESLLKETLESFVAAVDEEPEFFKQNGLQQLWPLLVQMCNAQSFSDTDLRQIAMEALMSLTVGLCEDFCKSEAQPFLEQLVILNIEWMMEVEEDVDAWTRISDKDDDELDGEIGTIAEENLDRLADKFSDEEQMEDVFMPVLFKVIRAALASPAATWKHSRAAVIAINQIVEYVEEEAWIDQCVEFIVNQLAHPHPRVRASAFQAAGQAAYDHSPYIQEQHYDSLLPAVVIGLDDVNIRVASNAAEALSSIGDELDQDALSPYLSDLMTKLVLRLQAGQTQGMQEHCLSSIAVLAEVAEEDFVPYYKTVMPLMKQLISSCSREEQRSLRGKAFECASLIGDAVGADTFTPDAHEVMQLMVMHLKAGFAADDPTREYVHEACARVAGTLKKAFKPYLEVVLPGVFTVLASRPQELDQNNLPDEDDEDMSLLLASDGKVVGLKTSVLNEMKEALVLIRSMIAAVEDDFCDFLPLTCQHMLPLLEFSCEDIRTQSFEVWEAIVDCARMSSERGKCEKSVVVRLVSEFLKTTVALMAQPAPKGLDSVALSKLQAQAGGVSGVLQKAGPGVLAKGDVADLLRLLVELLGRVTVAAETPAVSSKKHNTGMTMAEEDGDEEEDESNAEAEEVTPQSVRFSLADMTGAIMRANRSDFVEVGMTTVIELVRRLTQPTSSNADRSLGFYMADDVVDILGELSIPSWNFFMEQACRSITDKCPVVRQYASSTIGNGARQPIFAQIAPMAASQLARVLQKYGERHRRRRAVNTEAKELALSVDASIWALGMICEHHEKNIGGDSSEAWKMWLANLPLRYDQDVGQKTHAQLLELVVKSHAVVTAPAQLPRVLSIFAEVYKSHFSNPVLDKEIAVAIARAGKGMVEGFGASLPEKQRTRVEVILADGLAALS